MSRRVLWRIWAFIFCFFLTLPGPVRASDWTLRAVFFDCGKADSALIQTEEGAVLIDAATNDGGKAVVAKLRALGVRRLDALIISHPHKDHIGGADRILEAFEVDRVYVGPLQVESKQVRQFDEVMAEQGKEAVLLRAGETVSLPGMELTCLGPLLDFAEDENDLSLVLRLSHGDVSFLFTGDAEREALDALMLAERTGASLASDVLKVPHHGGAERNSLDFFTRVSPKIAVIPCGRDPKEGLPEEAVLRALSTVGAEVYVTGDGDVEIHTDGKTVWVKDSHSK